MLNPDVVAECDIAVVAAVTVNEIAANFLSQPLPCPFILSKMEYFQSVKPHLFANPTRDFISQEYHSDAYPGTLCSHPDRPLTLLHQSLIHPPSPNPLTSHFQFEKQKRRKSTRKSNGETLLETNLKIHPYITYVHRV